MVTSNIPGISSERDESLELDYWYDAQIRRYLVQFARLFSTIRWRATTRGGQPLYRRVPVRMASTNRQAAWVNRGGIESNRMLVVPMMTVNIAGIEHSGDRRMSPYHREKQRFYERSFDRDTQEYGQDRGQAWTIERHMPVPYDLFLDLDVWTSNLDQKLQIFEQIALIFNPALDLYSSEGPFDWGALTYVHLTDFEWNPKSFPVPLEEIDVMTFRFRMPIWLSPPARLQPQKIVTTIANSLVDARRVADIATDWKHWTPGIRYDRSDLLGRQYITPGDRWIRIEGNEVRLLGPNSNELDPDGNPYTWTELLERQPGIYVPGETQLVLLDPNDVEDFDAAIVGVLDDGPDDTIKIWNVDPSTLPAPTLSPIDAIIDPRSTWPGNGLPPPTDGVRYLIIDDIAPSTAWPNFEAQRNDIIEFANGVWLRAFVAEAHADETHIVVNNATGRTLRFDGENWTDLLEGDHPPGLWRIGFARPVEMYSS